MTLTQGHTTLKREAVAYTSVGMLDVYRLLLSHDSTYRVHIERRERNGAIGEAYLYQGSDLDAANRVFNRYSQGGAS